MLPKYKLLATLYLCQRFNGSKSSPPSAVDIFRHLLGTSYSQTLSRLIKEKLISLTSDTGHVTHDQSQLSVVSDHRSNVAITYLGTNALLSHYPLLDYCRTYDTGQMTGRTADMEQMTNDQSQLSSVSGQRSYVSGQMLGVRGQLLPHTFTLVVFNIPEEKRQVRDRLRYVLKSAGFGQINRSLYLSPHLTIKEALQMTNDQMTNDKKLKTMAFSVPFESFMEMDQKVLTSFWDLKEVEELYDEALSVTTDTGHVTHDQSQLSVVSGQMSAGKAGRFLSKFLDAFGKDPFLPPLLLPNNWPGRKALEIAREILTT